ncbi:unnamed protein product [Enterobius vermicularis]|uniref:HSF_DOMAIN domain-containing protein n=1 Tax=Enterobius vermicularis TaxID=51028 RepID=A0A0N4VEF3_ENTVE|nr:unnamed protein product [Enterobius vermicularis]
MYGACAGDADLNTVPSGCYLSDLYQQLDELIIKNPVEKLLVQVCDDSVGVVPNDKSGLVLNVDAEQFFEQFLGTLMSKRPIRLSFRRIQRTGMLEKYFAASSHPE